MKKIKSYNEAITALDKTIKQLESDEISVDDLTAKVKEATELVNYCKKQLRATEKEIASTLENLD